MNLKFIIVLSLLLISIPINAQQGWFWQNPLPQGNTLRDVHIFNTDVAIAIGYNGIILKTINGGTDWSIKYSNSKHLLYFF